MRKTSILLGDVNINRKFIITSIFVLFLILDLSNTKYVKAADNIIGFKEEWNTMPYLSAGTDLITNTGGILKLKSSTADPSITMLKLGSFDPDLYRYVEVRYKMNTGTPSTGFEIYFINDEYKTVNTQEQCVEANKLIADGSWHSYLLDMWSNPKYRNGGNITGLRYDWATNKEVNMELDYIQLVKLPVCFEEQWDTTPYQLIGTDVLSNSMGILRLKSKTGDPLMTMYNIGSFDPNVFRYMEVRYKLDVGMPSTGFEIFFLNNEYKEVYTQEQSVRSNDLTADGKWHTYYLDMWSNSKYRIGGYITGWRYDWATNKEVNMELDYIRLVKLPVCFEEQWNSTPYKLYGTEILSNSDGVLKLRSSSADPVITMYNIGSFDPNVYRYMEVRYKLDAGTSSTGTEIYFLNDKFTDVYTQEQFVGSNKLIADGRWHTYYLDMWSNPRYRTGGNITGWRYDWSYGKGIVMELDYIRLIATDMITPMEASISFSAAESYDTSYKIYAINTGIDTSKVFFPSWTAENGQDDLIWHEGKYIGNNTWEFVVSVKDHNAEYGEYITHVYTVDNLERYQYIGEASFNVLISGLVYQYDANNRIKQILKDNKPYIIFNYDKNGNLLSKKIIQ